MPNYNQSQYILKAVESIVNQSYSSWELIIVDDASTDCSLNKIKTIIEFYKDKDIKLIQNKKNQGPAVSRNRGIQVATGEYIALLDSDDYYKPDKIKEQLSYLIENKVDAVYTDVEILDTVTRNSTYLAAYHEKNQANLLVRALERQVIVAPATIMIRRKCLEEIKYDERMYHAEDYKFTLDLLQKCAVGYQSRADYVWRRHESNMTNEKVKQSQAERKVVRDLGVIKIVEMVDKTTYTMIEKKILLLKIFIKIDAHEEVIKLIKDYDDVLCFNVEYNFYVATYYYKRKQYDQAVERLLRLENDQELPEVDNNIGCCYMHLNEKEKAQWYFTRASKKNPHYIDAKLNLNNDGNKRYTERMLRQQLVPYISSN